MDGGEEVVDYSRLVKEIFDTCLGVEEKTRVWLHCWDHTIDLAKALASECTLRGCPHLLTVRYEDVWLRSILEGPKEFLEAVPPQEAAALAETNFYIFAMGPRNPVPWSSIPADRRGEVSLWLDTRYDNSAYAKEWARIAKAHRVKMLSVEATLATPERAKAFGLRYEEWRDEMFRGCMVDHREMARKGKILAKLLAGNGNIHVETPSGTRLSLTLDQRPVEISDGIITEKMAEAGNVVFLPAGGAEVSVDEESVEGRIVYDAPVRLGSEMIENLTVDLREGCIQRCSAMQGGRAFEEYLKGGGRDAGRFAFLGFGLNPNLRYGFTQDDKVLGGLTLGFGSNGKMGGKNVASDQWWASIGGGTVRVDGTTVVMDKGKLLV